MIEDRFLGLPFGFDTFAWYQAALATATWLPNKQPVKAEEKVTSKKQAHGWQYLPETTTYEKAHTLCHIVT